MPAHFTHIYTARRTAEHLISGEVPDWPAAGTPMFRRSPQACGQAMKDWEKFTAVGAIGPDLFYFSQDWNTEPLAPLSDEIMLGLAIYYFFDAASEDNWEPLLIILDGVSSTLAALLRFLIKLDNIWKQFVAGWNATIGPIVADITNLGDAITGGLLSQAKVVIDELGLAIKSLGEQELLTYADIFGKFNTCVQKGFDEPIFLWSDMSHYRRPSALSQAFAHQVELMETQAEELLRQGKREDADAMAQQADQFLAFTLGYITHLGLDTVAHSFVNEQCGGPFRDHPQRHHLIEQHIDAWNYHETRPGGSITPDPWGWTETYPDTSMNALWFAVQLTPENPAGVQRPPGPFASDDDRKAQLDVDGEMPDWMANAIVAAMIETFADHDHPLIYGGSDFQSALDSSLFTTWLEKVLGGSDPGKPIPELLADIAPAPPFQVPRGFPLPWQIKTMYKVMYSFYRLAYNGTWELVKPKKPDFIILPPASDFSNLLQPPDFSGVDSSNPVEDVCAVFVALFEWAAKMIAAAGQLIDDLIEMVASPGSYLFRLALYELAMMIWDIVVKTHEILAHTGFFSPHGLLFDADGELMMPNEIDESMVTLGLTVDDTFRAALGDAIDPLGNLDRNQDVIGTTHPIPDPGHPYYPVLHYDSLAANAGYEDFEYHRPWAFPKVSVFGPNNQATPTPTETYNPFASFGEGPNTAYKPLRAGPYPVGAKPNVFFRVNAPLDEQVRRQYEAAQTPWETDQLNEQHISNPKLLRFSPLGDPIDFSAHLIGQLVNPTGFSTQFNLDSDRAYAYLTWDWIRGDKTATVNLGQTFTYKTPKEPPQLADGWAHGRNPLLLEYKDPPNPLPAPPPPPPIR